MVTLHDWQQEDVDTWVDACLSGRSTSVFCAWEQSLGKTLATVEFAKRLDVETMLIVAPLNTRSSWKKALDQQWPDHPEFRYVSKKRKDDIVNITHLANRKPGVYFIGWELMRGGSIFGSTVDLIVADETHRQQNRGSDSHYAIKGCESKYKIALSGTPAGNKPDGIYATLHWLWPDRYKSHQKWVDTFWRVRRNGAIIDFVREITPGGVIADIPVFSRRKREEHRGDIPRALPEVAIDVEMTPKQHKLYDAFLHDSAAWINGTFVPASMPLVENLRLTEITLGVPTVGEDGKIVFDLNCASSKMAMLFDVLAGQPQDATMLVLCPSAKFIPSAVHQLNKKGYSARGFSGELTPANSPERDAALEEFGTKFRVLVAGIAAIAEGTDGLQYKCSRNFWLAKHARNDLNQQAKWRLDRPGQTEPVQSWYTWVPGTVDEDRLERLEETQENLEEMLDNHRGVALE